MRHRPEGGHDALELPTLDHREGMVGVVEDVLQESRLELLGGQGRLILPTVAGDVYEPAVVGPNSL